METKFHTLKLRFMKKSLVLMILAIGFAFSFTACSDDEEDTCYECVYANFAGCLVDICDGEAVFTGTCPSGITIGNGLTNEQIRDLLENDPEISCSEK